MKLYEFDKVLNGITKYIGSEMYSSMNDLQEFTARVLIGRVLSNGEFIKDKLINNVYIRSFGLVDSNGMVDVHGLAKDIKRELTRKGKIVVDVPMFGKLTFIPSDVTKLYTSITGEEYREEN
jgi:hypothetical protein